VRIWSDVEKPTIAQETPMPAIGRRRARSGATGDQTEIGEGEQASPRPTSRTSPTRRRTAAAVTPPAIEPTPWMVAKDAEERRRLSERRDHVEDQRLGESDDEERQGDSPDDLAQRQRLPDVAEPGCHLADEVVLRRRRLLLRHAHAREEEGGRGEGGGVEHRHRAPAEHRVQPGASERRDDPQALRVA
jgi:hypothetical protein